MSQSPLYTPIPLICQTQFRWDFGYKTVIRTILTITAVIVTHSYLLIYLQEQTPNKQTNKPRLRKIESTRKARRKKNNKNEHNKASRYYFYRRMLSRVMKILFDLVLLWISSLSLFDLLLYAMQYLSSTYLIFSYVYSYKAENHYYLYNSSSQQQSTTRKQVSK